MRAGLVAVILLCVALVPRAYDLNRFATWDELFWTHASLRFWRAAQAGNWSRTYIIGQPGVVSMWLASGAATVKGVMGGETEWETIRAAGRPRYDPNDLQTLGRVADQWRSLTIVTALAASLAVAGVFLLARLLVGGPAAVLGSLLLAFDPFFLAHSRVMALDAILASLMLLSLLAFLVYRQRGLTRFLVLSASLGGLAALQKTTGVFVLGFVGLLSLVAGVAALRRGQTTRLWPLTIRPVMLWTGLAALTYVAVWPAMWTAPLATLGELVKTLRAYAPTAYDPTYFLGQATTAPGALFYPAVAVFRTTPMTWLGLGLVGWQAERRDKKLPDPTVGALLLFALLYGVALSLSSAKFERYLLPALLPLDLVAGVGLAALVWGQAAAKHTRLASGLGLLLVAQCALVLALHPYHLAWYNPLVGGQRAAARVLPLGWGEGMDHAARYLAAQPDASRLRVATWGAVGLAPWFRGQVVPPTLDQPWRDADYLVVYMTDIQREDEIARVGAGMTPAFSGRVHDLDYVHVYRLRP